MRPTILQLEYLVAAARTLNFRQAAADMHATQPAVSAQIRKLEEVLGVQLFERDRRRVLLTEPGSRLAAAAAKILADVDDLRALVGDADDAMSGDLRLGMIPTLAPFALPQVFAAVREAHPDLHLEVREGPTQALLAQLRDGALDLLFLAIDVDLGQVDTIALFDDAFLAALPEDHELAAHETVSIADFASHPVMLLEEGHCLADQAREVCAKAGSPAHSNLRATSLTTLVRMVAAGQGITMLPEIARADLESTPGLALRRFAAPQPSRRLGLAWRPGTQRAPLFRKLGELFEAACAPPDA